METTTTPALQANERELVSKFGTIRVTFESATRGVAYNVGPLTINGIAYKFLRYGFTLGNRWDRVTETSYVHAGYDHSVGLTLTREGGSYNDATSNARNKITDYICDQVTPMLMSDAISSIGNENEIASLLEWAESRVRDAEKTLADRRARVAELQAQAATNGAFCNERQAHNGKPCKRPHGHLGHHADARE